MVQSFESSRRSSNRSSAASTCSPASSFVSETKPTKPALVNHRNNHSPSESPQHSPKIRQSVRFSDRGPVILNGRPPATRSEAPEPPEQGNALSAVDQTWGMLFDDRGEPTARLGQVLRGIANYLVSFLTTAAH